MVHRPRLEGPWRCDLTVSRRLFLRRGFVAAAAACAGSPLLALGGRRPADVDEGPSPSLRTPSSTSSSNDWRDHAGALDHMDRAAFAGAVGTNFKVLLTPGSSPVWTTLLAVEDLPQIAPANPGSFAVPAKASSFVPPSSGFVLVFGGSSPLPQDTYLFEHDALGRFALLTVPAGNGQQLYNAVVNRLDTSHVVAVAYGNAQAASAASVAPAAGNAALGFRDSAPTSSAIEAPAPARAGNPAARRSALRD
jgi:uncharacterized protein DUF6916